MTTNTGAAKAFYGAVVGWGTQDVPMPGMTYTLFTVGETHVSGLMDLPEDARNRGAPPSWVGYVAVDDVDATAEHAKRLGGAVHVPPRDIPNVGRFSIIADPQGATLGLLFRASNPGQDHPPELGSAGRAGWDELLATNRETAFACYGELFVYRPGFSGHKILLCGGPDWGACGEPFAPGLSRAAVGILLQQPVLVIARNEGPDRNANLLGIAENPAPHDLLLEGADEALRHTVGLGLADEGKARRHAEEGDLVLEVVGHKGAAVVVAEQKATGGVGPHRPAGVVDGEIESLSGGEAIGLFGDVPAEHLSVPVLDDHEEGDVAVLNGWDHGRVRAPHHAGRIGGDASGVVVDRPLRAAVRREQSILAHEAQHPVPADAEAIESAQAGPDLAVPLAGEGRAIEVAADRLEQPRIIDHRPRPAPPARGRRRGDRPGGAEGGARHAPGGTNPSYAVGLAGRRGVRGGHQRDLLRAKGPGRSMRARSNSTSLESSPIRRWASASSRAAGSSERSRSPVLSPARARARQPSSCQTGTPSCRETASTGSPRSRRNTTSCLRARLQR